jgi:hypothetical protein
MGLLDAYEDVLERAYIGLLSAPHHRSKPRTLPDGKTPVYVFDVDRWWPHYGPFMTEEDVLTSGIFVPILALPNRSTEPLRTAERRRVLASAVHELTHVFNATERPLRLATGSNSQALPWLWYNEGLAIFMESQILPWNCDGLRYALNWVDESHVPLDIKPAWYQAGLFVRYLARRTQNLGFPSQVWMEARPDESPFEAITRLIPGGNTLAVSAIPGQADVFASGFCLDSYFELLQGASGAESEVARRFGQRAVTYSFRLSLQELDSTDFCDDSDPQRFSLDHLSCRYYRFFPEALLKRIRIEIWMENDVRLKAHVAEVRRNVPIRGIAIPLERQGTKLVGEVGPIAPADVEHLVLLVVNCGLYGRRTPQSLDSRDDDLKFRFKVSVER